MSHGIDNHITTLDMIIAQSNKTLEESFNQLSALDSNQLLLSSHKNIISENGQVIRSTLEQATVLNIQDFIDINCAFNAITLLQKIELLAFH